MHRKAFRQYPTGTLRAAGGDSSHEKLSEGDTCGRFRLQGALSCFDQLRVRRIQRPRCNVHTRLIGFQYILTYIPTGCIFILIVVMVAAGIDPPSIPNMRACARTQTPSFLVDQLLHQSVFRITFFLLTVFRVVVFQNCTRVML